MPIITHGDLDGFVSALIVMGISNITPDRVHNFSYASYRDEQWQRLLGYQIQASRSLASDTQDVWFTDLSLRPGELDWARGKQKRSLWHWVDHHVSSKDFDPDGVFHETDLQTDVNKCAADILWDRYGDQLHKSYPELEVWVRVAHDRDLWIRNDALLGLQLTLLIQKASFEKSWKSLLAQAQKVSPKTLLVLTPHLWKDEMGRYESSVQTAKTTAYTAKAGDIPLVISHITGYGSDVSETLYDNGDEIVVLIHTMREGLVVNLRTRREDVDLSLLAKEVFSGGGHKQAAGGRLSEKHLRGGYIAITRDIVTFLKPMIAKKVTTRKGTAKTSKNDGQ